MAVLRKPANMDKAVSSALDRQVKTDSRTEARKLVDRLTAQAMRDSAATLTQQRIDRLGKA